MKLIYVTLIYVVAVQCCKNPTFENVKIKASKYFSSKNESNDIQLDTLTGCITPTEELKGALIITITKQHVPILNEGAVQNMPWLHDLILEDNGIEEIQPGAFHNLETLVTINLSKNQIKIVREGVFNGMELKRLLLNNNQISKIEPGAFDNMANLNRIDLDRNQLQEWNADWFANTPNIINLSARDNQIKKLPADAFKNIYDVKKSSKTKLSILLGNNKIEVIDKNAFKGLKDLEMLDVEKNYIVNLDDELFLDMKSVNILLLGGNKIKCLPESVLDSLPVTELTNLDNNPINCVCLKSMENWSKKTRANIKTSIRKIECMQERIKNVLDSVKNRQ